MFSSNDIVKAMKSGKITISEFDLNRLNPNSYDVVLGNWFYLLFPKGNGDPRYYGPLQVKDGIKVLVPSGMTLLGMTKDRIGSFGDILGQLRSKSTTRRTGITVCDDAGFGDVGYSNHWTVELTAHVPGPGAYLEVGKPFAQILFQRTETEPIKEYEGQYNADDWPSCMLPKKFRGKEKSWAELDRLCPQEWVK